MEKRIDPDNQKINSFRLIQLRREMGLSQRELAKEFEVTAGAIALWETGKRDVPGPVIKLIEIYETEFGISLSIDELVLERQLAVSRLQRTLSFAKGAQELAFEWLKLILLDVAALESERSRIRSRGYALMTRKLCSRLFRMRGLATKLFQLMTQFSFLLPPEAVSEFSKFSLPQRPMARKTVASIIKLELGNTPSKIFSSWTATPFATASIGQVHRARLPTGEKVAVKIQYPDIEKCIRADLKNLAVIEGFCRFFLRGQDKKIIINEFAARFLEECDYINEAKNQVKFRKIYLGRTEILIPNIYTDFSNKRILVSQYIRAKSFGEFLKTSSESQRNFAGITIWKFAYESILNHGIFNADPQPGNFRFLESQIVFLDFGCVTEFDQEFRQKFKNWLRCLLADDPTAHRASLLDLGIAPSHGEYDFEAHYEAVRSIYRPMLIDEECTFNSQELIQSWKRYFVDSPNRTKFNHSKEWVFQLRLVWGLTFVLAELGAKANWRRLLLSLIENDSNQSFGKLTSRLH